MVQAQWVSERRALGRFVTEQPPYSLLVRGIEADVLPVAAQYGMGVLPWSPLAGGWLTGGYRKDQDLPESRRRTRIPGRFAMSSPDYQRKLDAADALGQLADGAGQSLIHLALAFVIQHPGVTSPIIGPRTMEHLQSQLGAAEVKLSTDILDKIDEIVPPGVTIARSDQGYEPQHRHGHSADHCRPDLGFVGAGLLAAHFVAQPLLHERGPQRPMRCVRPPVPEQRGAHRIPLGCVEQPPLVIRVGARFAAGEKSSSQHSGLCAQRQDGN
jgi:hypothetical protein